LILCGDVLYVAVSEPHVDHKTQSPVYFKVAMDLKGGGLFISNHLHKSQGLRTSLRAPASHGPGVFSLFSLGELISRLREAGFVAEDVMAVDGT
jgi:hypothetical protein